MSELAEKRRRGPQGPRGSVDDRVLELLASGAAVSRTELAQRLGMAPSTVSTTVTRLVSRGAVTEHGTLASTGGRPRKVLRLAPNDDYALAADLGGRHARVGVVLPGGEVSSTDTVALDVTAGPERTLTMLAERLDALRAARPAGALRALGLAVPGPVEIASGRVVSPARLPGWHDFDARGWLAQRFDVAVAVDNDANLMALGEHAAHPDRGPQSIVVKAGSAIGAGIVVDDRVYRGSTGAAGDFSHVRIDAGGDTPCTCGNVGCLETVASGAALVRQLRERGAEVASTADVVARAADADPETTAAVRRAGHLLGEVLSANVNFFNPDSVYLAGALSTAEPFVAAVRSQLYEACHPLATRSLFIERASLGADVGVVGAGLFALASAAGTRDVAGRSSRAAG